MIEKEQNNETVSTAANRALREVVHALTSRSYLTAEEYNKIMTILDGAINRINQGSEE